MKKNLIVYVVALLFISFINASSGPICPCTIEAACYTEDWVCYGTISCSGEECIGGLNWVECDGEKSLCVSPL